MIARLFASLRGLLHRRRIDGEIAEELRDHLERATETHQARVASRPTRPAVSRSGI